MIKKMHIRCPFRPFSLQPGTKVMLPLSRWECAVYPTLLRFTSLQRANLSEELEIKLSLPGPIDRWVVTQDLDRGAIHVHGHTPKGYFSYCIVVKEGIVHFELKRFFCEKIELFYRNKPVFARKKLPFSLGLSSFHRAPMQAEKIHFGCHKTQDWALIKRRNRLAEIIPMWLRLGHTMPTQLPLAGGGPSAWLCSLEELIAERDRVRVGPAILHLFRGFFEGMLVPRSGDVEHWGYDELASREGALSSPLFLLGKGAKLLRSLFLQVRSDQVCAVLPCLPIALHAGRLINAQAHGRLGMDLEWSKKQVRRMILSPTEDCALQLQFFSKERSFRVRTHPRDRGRRVFVEQKLSLKGGMRYFCDRFSR